MSIENESYLEAKQRVMEKTLSEEAYSKLTQKEKNAYQLSLKVDRDLVNSFDTANQVGFEKGFQQGLEEMRKKKAYEIAKKFLEKGIDIKTIMLITRLTEAEIKEVDI